jgi:hypothetical protein
VRFQQTCPRCGEDFSDHDATTVAGAIVQHATTEHRHRLDHAVILAHLHDRHPHDNES